MRASQNTLSLLGSILLALSANADRVYHVAQDGKDSADGLAAVAKGDSKTGPFGTIDAALAAVARFRLAATVPETIRIQLHGQTIALNSPLRITPEMSGFSPSNPLIIESAPGASATLSGGRQALSWKAVPNERDVWTTQIPGQREGMAPRQLFADGKRLTRARTPNTGYFQSTSKLRQAGDLIEIPFKAGDIKPTWAQEKGAEVFILEKWTQLILPIRSIDSAAQVVRLPGKLHEWMTEPDARFWFENTRDGVDQPGEWCVDTTTGVLTLNVAPGEDPNKMAIVAPQHQLLVSFEGDSQAKKPVRNVILRNLRLANADWSIPPEGQISPQAAVETRGAVRAAYAVDCAIENCKLEHIGGYGFDLGAGCQGWRITGNEVKDAGAGAIRVGEPGGAADDLNACKGHTISDNTFHHLGKVFPQAVGILLFQTSGNLVSHNEVSNLYYTAVSVGWTWGYQASPCHRNVIEFNHLHHIGQGALSDMGGIYTLGPQPGTILRNNLIHDIRSHDYGGWGLYTDEGSTGILLENNVVYGCKSSGFHQHYGRENVIRNNIFAFNTEHQLMRSREEDHLSFTFTNNIVVWDSGDLLGTTWNASTNKFRMDSNLYFDTRAGTDLKGYDFKGLKWAEWRQAGLDTASIIADPLFTDPAKRDFRLKPGSPALALGFKQIDLSTVGPRK